jgi:translation initiation factor 3 subunit D
MSVIDFNALYSASANLPQTENLSTYGTLNKYNSLNYKLTVKLEKPLERGYAAEMKFYHLSTSDDPVLLEFAKNKVANIYTTDSILAVLMSVLRSTYSFDIVVTKDADGNIFLDKRDDFLFDYLSVNENSNEPPADESDVLCNNLESLHKEHTTTNINFSQQVLFRDGEQGHQQNLGAVPFAQASDHLPSVVYQYRTFDLGDNTKICVRTEYDSYEVVEVKDKPVTRNLLVKSLLEYNQKITGGWRMKLETQKAGCFATELKANNCKLTKWLLQAHLANVSHIKLGWISRTNGIKDPNVHSVLGVTTHPVRELTSELGVDLGNFWGATKHILNILMSEKFVEGSYILLRDPNRKSVYIYKTTPNEFRQKKSAAK